MLSEGFGLRSTVKNELTVYYKSEIPNAEGVEALNVVAILDLHFSFRGFEKSAGRSVYRNEDFSAPFHYARNEKAISYTSS